MARQYILENQAGLLQSVLETDPKQATKIDEDGRTLIFWAISQNSPEMVAQLLEVPQDLSIADNAGWTVLHIAAAIGNPKVLDQLLNVAPPLTPPPIDAKTNGGQTALQLAVSKQHFDVVGMLIKLNANVKTKAKQGKTALQRAAAIGSLKMVERLLDAGAPINATDSNGWTALHDAVAEGNTDVVALLVKRGANTEVENNEDRKPVHVAPNLEYATEVDKLIKELKSNE